MKGKGFSITLSQCKTNISEKESEIKLFLDKIVEIINMKKLGDVVINKGSESLPGFSAIQMIETSHIALHTFSNNNSYMFSVESCRNFDDNKLIIFLLNYFVPNDYSDTVYSINLPKDVEK